MSTLKFEEALEIAVQADTQELMKKLIAKNYWLEHELKELKKAAHVRCENCGEMYSYSEGYENKHGFYCSNDCCEECERQKTEDNYLED